MGHVVGDVAHWIQEVIHSFGYGGLVVLVALSNLFLPVYTEIMLPFAGFLVGRGRFSFPLVLLAATAGSVAASLLLYYVGFRVGEDRLRRLVKRVERFRIFTVSDLDRASKFFERHGGKAVLIGQLTPNVGAMISIPAGMKRMPVFGRFLGFTILGGATWNGAFITLGWALGARWEMVERYMPVVEWAVLALLLAGGIFLIWRWRTRG
jgi:membrane protein DedA with SNARE-associated domain